MPTWDEICQVLEQLRTLIEEIQSELANLATVQERRPSLQQLLTACFATWDEIVEKCAERPRRGQVSNSHLQAFLARQLPSRECNGITWKAMEGAWSE